MNSINHSTRSLLGIYMMMSSQNKIRVYQIDLISCLFLIFLQELIIVVVVKCEGRRVNAAVGFKGAAAGLNSS